MVIVSEVIAQIGQTTVIVGAASWLAKSIFTSWLSKAVETHKTELGRSVEQFKVDLQRDLQLHQIRNSKLHDERAEVIKIMYENLIQMGHYLEQTFKPSRYIGDTSLEERAKKADEAVGIFCIHYNKNRIYFDTSTCSLVDTLVDYALKAVVSMREFLVDQTNEGLIKQKEDWHNSWHTITELMPSLKTQLENDFRKLLGVV